MNSSVRCCLQSVKQNIYWRRVHLNKICTKFICATPLCQIASREANVNYKSTDMGRAELVLLTNILSIHHLPAKKKLPVTTEDTSKLNCQLQNILTSNHHSDYGNITDGLTIPCPKSRNRKELMLWEDILIKPTYIMEQKQCKSKELYELMSLKPNIWYCNYHKTTRNIIKVNKNCLEFNSRNMVNKETQHNKCVDKWSRGPSPEQLSLVLLRLREEMPHFFEGHHRYSIYSKDILFVNRLTRTTTRSLKAYKCLMNFMKYSGRLFWNNVSLDIVHITKHPEDNTIKLRWTAKGVPWYYIPFYNITGKPQSSPFYRYVDGFSIFEVGRDGLVHCHRLDKVIPTSTPERQRWSLRAQILTLLGLTEIERGACEAFQNEDILNIKKA